MLLNHGTTFVNNVIIGLVLAVKHIGFL